MKNGATKQFKVVKTIEKKYIDHIISLSYFKTPECRVKNTKFALFIRKLRLSSENGIIHVKKSGLYKSVMLNISQLTQSNPFISSL